MTTIVKLFVGKKQEPQFFVFRRFDMDKRRMLVTFPTFVPDRKRMARWFDFDEVRVDWIRDFVE